MNLRANMVDEFPVTLSCLKDQTWSEGTKMMKLMRSSEVSNLFCNLTKSSRKVVLVIFYTEILTGKVFCGVFSGVKPVKKSTIQLFKSKSQYRT